MSTQDAVETTSLGSRAIWPKFDFQVLSSRKVNPSLNNAGRFKQGIYQKLGFTSSAIERAPCTHTKFSYKTRRIKKISRESQLPSLFLRWTRTYICAVVSPSRKIGNRRRLRTAYLERLPVSNIYLMNTIDCRGNSRHNVSTRVTWKKKNIEIDNNSLLGSWQIPLVSPIYLPWTCSQWAPVKPAVQPHLYCCGFPNTGRHVPPFWHGDDSQGLCRNNDEH